MPNVTAIAVVPLVLILLYAFISFDRLLRAEYEQHRSSWESDGRPAGFFWRAKECDFLRSRFAYLRVSLSWLVRTPVWAADSPKLKAMLWRHRFAVLAWNIGVVVWFVCFLHGIGE